jgi:hypothetical protein|tara:strand:- start:276 stop:401 length:126 start_codon:yes stop_codon:yes gene_type:complete
MWEGLRHALGLCGEPHPSLLWLIMFTPIVSYTIAIIKEKLK